jgi:hypothetical protein
LLVVVVPYTSRGRRLSLVVEAKQTKRSMSS